MLDAERDALLDDFQAWAAGRQHAVDLMLLDELLELRAAYDDLGETFWPAGSVEHLLLERWPSKGAVEPPPEQVLADTLQAWFRFLRGTGRMASRSADPRELTKEVRRAAPRMAEVAGDRSHWSSTKVILDHARSVGLDLDLAQDEEQLQAMLAQAQESWNSLPVDERRRLMPDPSGSGLPRTDEDPMSGAEEVALRTGLDPVDGMVALFLDRMPDRDLPGLDVVVPQLQASPYVRQVRALAAWVGEGRELTSTDVLRPAVAREAYDALGLVEWDRTRARASVPRHVVASGRSVEDWVEEAIARPWRSAADCEALDRLWWGAMTGGVVRPEGRRVVAVDRDPDTPEEWLGLGIAVLAGLVDRLAAHELAVALHVLLTSLVEGGRLVAPEEVDRFYAHWLLGDDAISEEALTGWGWASLVRVLDTGLLEQGDDGVRITALGETFVAWWVTDRFDMLED